MIGTPLHAAHGGEAQSQLRPPNPLSSRVEQINTFQKQNIPDASTTPGMLNRLRRIL